MAPVGEAARLLAGRRRPPALSEVDGAELDPAPHLEVDGTGSEAREETEATAVPFAPMPEELLVRCIATLPALSAHYAVSATCRSLRALSLHDAVWRERLVQDFPLSPQLTRGSHRVFYLGLRLSRLRADEHLRRRCPWCWPELGVASSAKTAVRARQRQRQAWCRSTGTKAERGLRVALENAHTQSLKA
eukprot:TRINITY_DN64435_c0_g1_i1.p3 TRINITY_DN64435_c0_g1~~TRINITY_DN64435_c0_g1_i1.p3  ORF type:complete len:215 (-),score=35.75 TRINITY_DN64435_c0_g1_i1:81-650(-)